MGSSDSRPTRIRYGVMAYLCSLAFILYIDRVCISQAAKRMKTDLDLTNTQMGDVFGAFMISYAIFEIVTGHWGDRYGSRRVLTRIVLWWSAFTALTGCVWKFSFSFEGASGTRFVIFNSFSLLLLIRFLFGAGEAGALPNAARVIAQWFPPGRRGPAQALISMSAQIGGAVAPPVAAFLILTVGWRWSFVIFGSLGVYWAFFFSRWFRDHPADHPGVNAAERDYILGGRTADAPGEAKSSDGAPRVETIQARGHTTAQPPEQSIPQRIVLDENHQSGADRVDLHHHRIPWAQVFRNPNIWLLGFINACASFYSYMLFSWFPTYLKEGRGLGEIESSRLAMLPYLFGATGVMLGGYLGDWLTARTGSRRFALGSLGFGGLLCGGFLVGSSVSAETATLAALLCAMGFFCAYIQLAAWWAAMGDIGGRHLGALFGMCNMIGLAGGFVSQVFLGRFADHMQALGYTGRAQWDPAFYLYGGVLMFGGLLWLMVNPRRAVVPADAARA
jgi:sugar phosphate permease